MTLEAALGAARDRAVATGRARRAADVATVAACLAVATLLLVAALAPSLLAPGDPFAIDPLAAFSPPSFAHPFGTDESGRDVYTRIVHGAASSLLIGLAATAIGLGLGLLLGALAGLGPRWLDFMTTRVVEVFFAFPGILLALLLIVLVGPGAATATIAVGLSTAPGYARIIRGQFRQVKDAGYVEADVVMGRSWWHRLTRTVLPNTIAPLFVLATLGIGQAVVWASALSYLGLGDPPPSPEWGAMLSAGRTYLLTGIWWLTVCPGLAIVASAVASTLLGRAIERSRRAR